MLLNTCSYSLLDLWPRPAPSRIGSAFKHNIRSSEKTYSSSKWKILFLLQPRIFALLLFVNTWLLLSMCSLLPSCRSLSLLQWAGREALQFSSCGLQALCYKLAFLPPCAAPEALHPLHGLAVAAGLLISSSRPPGGLNHLTCDLQLIRNLHQSFRKVLLESGLPSDPLHSS